MSNLWLKIFAIKLKFFQLLSFTSMMLHHSSLSTEQKMWSMTSRLNWWFGWNDFDEESLQGPLWHFEFLIEQEKFVVIRLWFERHVSDLLALKWCKGSDAWFILQGKRKTIIIIFTVQIWITIKTSRPPLIIQIDEQRNSSSRAFN